MPVAVRLSKNFYDRFGDEATNELVTLLNDVDLTYRSELKDAFAANIAVFDAKLEQRLAEVNARMDTQFAQLRTEMHEVQSTLIRWMFLFFIGTALTIIGFR